VLGLDSEGVKQEISDATFREFALPSRSSAEQLRVHSKGNSHSVTSTSRRAHLTGVYLIRNSQARDLPSSLIELHKDAETNTDASCGIRPVLYVTQPFLAVL
jgi:hypothetical protein